MKLSLLIFTVLITSMPVLADDYIGNYSVNPYFRDSISNDYGAGNRYDPRSVLNPHGEYGSQYSNKSATNQYATDAPSLHDSQGNYRGKLSSNQYDPDSVSNRFGRFGSEFSPDSINNQFGAGNRFDPDSPYNQFGYGLRVQGR